MIRVWELLRALGLRKQLTRLASTIAGAAILYHEVWIADTSEPLLIFLGLWLLGVPPAMFFDGLRKVSGRAESELSSALTADTSGVPEGSPEPEPGATPPPPERRFS